MTPPVGLPSLSGASPPQSLCRNTIHIDNYVHTIDRAF
jgi:hypothetical protein